MEPVTSDPPREKVLTVPLGIFGIHEVEPEIFCQDQRVEIFAATGGVVPTGGVKHGVTDVFQLAVHIEGQPEIRDDLVVPANDLLIGGINDVARLACADQLVAAVQQIRDLGVSLAALAGGGGNDVPPGGVCFDDCGDLPEMIGICQ